MEAFEDEFGDVLDGVPGEHFDADRFVPGDGPLDADLMLVGEAPGANEVEEGRPFVGRGGDVLDDALEAAGIDRADTYVTNLVKVRPPDNRDPHRAEIAAWKPVLTEEVSVVDPGGIVALGRIATDELTAADGTITELRGNRVEADGRAVYPTFHPAATLYDRSRLEPFRADVERAVRRAGD